MNLTVSEFPGIHIEAIQPPVPAPVAHIDYSEEAMEYEKKLVQVTAALFLPVDWIVLAFSLLSCCELSTRIVSVLAG